MDEIKLLRDRLNETLQREKQLRVLLGWLADTTQDKQLRDLICDMLTTESN